jgi:ubiquinone/menaquinone biosynthesis C-methylase UbiE
LGGGTGITTLSILNACQPSHILSIDNEATMQKQAMAHLSAWVDSGHLSFSLNDALSALQQIDSASVDLVASSYTLHNFRYDYRQNVLREIFRVLKPGGSFVNGDRYALNDKELHTRSIQTEVAHYFKVLKSLDRLDLLESWVLHVLNDESENHLMRESIALEQMLAVGFEGIGFSSRQDVTAVCTAKKIA